MAWYDFLNPFKAVESVGKVVNNVAQTFTGSQKERDLQNTNAFISTQAQYGKEFNQKNRNFLDSLVDGYNRIIRPSIVTIVIYYFHLSYSDTIQFQKINTGLSTVPEPMWYVLSAIIGFYFCARELHKHRQSKLMLSDSDFKKVQDRMKTLDNMKKEQNKIDEADSDEYL